VQRTLNWVHLASRYPVRVRVSKIPKPELFSTSANSAVGPSSEDGDHGGSYTQRNGMAPGLWRGCGNSSQRGTGTISWKRQVGSARMVIAANVDHARQHDISSAGSGTRRSNALVISRENPLGNGKRREECPF